MNILKGFGVWIMAMIAVILMPLLILAGYNVNVEVEKSDY